MELRASSCFVLSRVSWTSETENVIFFRCPKMTYPFRCPTPGTVSNPFHSRRSQNPRRLVTRLFSYPFATALRFTSLGSAQLRHRVASESHWIFRRSLYREFVTDGASARGLSLFRSLTQSSKSHKARRHTVPSLVSRPDVEELEQQPFG